MSELPVRAPGVNPETQPFWDATAQGRLELPVCNSCGFVVWYPRAFCTECESTSMSWTAMSGSGVIYSFTVVRSGVGSAWRPHLPFVIAYVELDEGPRMLTNVVDCDVDDIAIGMAVTAVFDPTEEGPAIVRFAPSG